MSLAFFGTSFHVSPILNSLPLFPCQDVHGLYFDGLLVLRVCDSTDPKATLRPPSSAHRPWYIPGGSIISHYSSGRCQIYCSFSYLAPSYVGTVAPKPCVTAVVPLIACVSCVAHRHRDLVGSANVFCPLRTISRGQRRSFMMHRKNH